MTPPSPPLDSAGPPIAAGSARDVARRIFDSKAGFFDRFGIEPNDKHYWLALWLYTRGASGEPIMQKSVAYGTDLPMTTAIRHLRTLADRGIVHYSAHDRDRRYAMISLNWEVERYFDSVLGGY